ncbi:MAG: hypothetical protein ABL907_03405, partial [Hyphomicrobium sp.]
GEAAYGMSFSEVETSWASVQQDTNFFKVRFVPFLLPALALLACLVSRRSMLLGAALLTAASVGFLVLDARSAGVSLLLSALVLTAIHYNFKPTWGRTLAVMVAMLPISYAGYSAYVSYTLSSVEGGNGAKQLRRLENPYNPLELLMQGRSDWTIYGEAISDRPFFGFGSWARDTEQKYNRLRFERSKNYEIAYQAEWDNGLIPVHSVIGASWIWCGLLGFVSAIFLLKSILTLAQLLPSVSRQFLPAAVVLTMALLWDFFFSPFQVLRLSFPPALATVIVLTAPILAWQAARRRTASPMPPRSAISETPSFRNPRR